MPRYGEYEDEPAPRLRGCACGSGLPGMCPGRSNCPYSGDGEPTEAEQIAELCEFEGSAAFRTTEDLYALLDRHSDDWGDDSDALADIASRLRTLFDEARALLGEPRATRRATP